MATLLEMVTEIVVRNVKTTPMTKDQLIKDIKEVYAALAALEKGDDEDITVEFIAVDEKLKPLMSAKKSIGRNAITCLICGESMKTLARHLTSKHDMKPGAYRKQFGIPRTQALAAKAYSESRKQMALDSGLGEKLIVARAANAAKRAAAPKGKKVSSARAKKEA
jgi:predicted transcriptional regulator